MRGRRLILPLRVASPSLCSVIGTSISTVLILIYGCVARNYWHRSVDPSWWRSLIWDTWSSSFRDCFASQSPSCYRGILGSKPKGCLVCDAIIRSFSLAIRSYARQNYLVLSLIKALLYLIDTSSRAHHTYNLSFIQECHLILRISCAINRLRVASYVLLKYLICLKLLLLNVLLRII